MVELTCADSNSLIYYHKENLLDLSLGLKTQILLFWKDNHIFLRMSTLTLLSVYNSVQIIIVFLKNGLICFIFLFHIYFPSHLGYPRELQMSYDTNN